MPIITQQAGAHNTPTDTFQPFPKHPESRETQPQTADNKIPRSARELLNIIVEYIGDTGTPVRLLQRNLAQRLEVSDTTIRRYTSTLTKAGLIQARRGRNCVIYSLPLRATPNPPALHRAAVGRQTAEPTPTTPPQRPADATLPTCPAHSIRRVSDMTQRTAHTVWHCTKRYRNHYCSWLYHQTLGTLQEPYRDELEEEEVLDLERRLLSGDQPPQHLSNDAPQERPSTGHTDPSPQPAEQPNNPWQSTLQNLAHLLPDPTKAAIIVANTSLLKVAEDVITVRVHQPRHLQWLTDPIHQSMANAAATKARSELTTVKFVS